MIKSVNICRSACVEGELKPSKVTLEVTLVALGPEERVRTGEMAAA